MSKAHIHDVDGPIESGPPRSSKVSAGLAALACAACCAIPLFIAAGVVTGAGALLLTDIFVALAVIGFIAAGGLWWWHHRRTARIARAAAAPGAGDCDGGSCSC